MFKPMLLSILLATSLSAAAGDAVERDSGERDAPKTDRAVSGIIYFTNNTPPAESLTVELLTRDERERIEGLKRVEWSFLAEGLRPQTYLLRLTWGNCTLRYEIDTRKRQRTRLQIIADAACSAHNGSIRPAPLDPNDEENR